MYHYAANNPVRYIDPDGRVFNIIAAGAGAIIGAGVGAVTTALAGGSKKDIVAAAIGGAAGGALAGFTCGASLAVTAAVGGVAVIGGATVAAGTDVAINAYQGNNLLDGVDKAALGGGIGGGVGYVAGVAIGSTVLQTKTPDKFQQTLNTVKETGNPPNGYKGGRTFQNRGGDGYQTLPKTDSNGNPINYKEWDVNPHIQGQNRGAERLVTGSDGSAWKTTDHYKTFTQME
ncbi:ribonuclease domain-containing protein [Treponema sp. UBA3813]|uniref:ribonuclease domain-containing protein n=1 Tax=Treponema sp. UBA3813 TaxID=1947715 RepID=UPI0025F10E72|nr:ribonuclease domain-containing protein [Treponema sp. UBA3813]